MKNIRTLAILAAAFTYALIVLGGVVRITGSGMGCGDHWPLCNGHIFPPLDDIATVIEWGHRLVALLVSLMVAATAGAALMLRRTEGVSGRGSPLNSAVLALVLLAVQVMLGAVTVWLELPAASVILHLGVAMALLATLMVTAHRTLGAEASEVDGKTRRGLIVAAGLAAATLLLGGLTANMNAAAACQGFPFCNGQLWPSARQGALVHIHWTHRLLAYALLLHSIGLPFILAKRAAPPAALFWVRVFALAVVAQVGVAAAMVLLHLPDVWRTAHVAVGTAVWAAAVMMVMKVRK
jgi:heme a synthase